MSSMLYTVDKTLTDRAFGHFNHEINKGFLKIMNQFTLFDTYVILIPKIGTKSTLCKI